MSLVSIVGLNKALPFQGALNMTTRGFRAGMYVVFPKVPNFLARPLAVNASKPRSFGGPLIHPGGCMCS